MTFNIYDIIHKKRMNQIHTPEEITTMIQAYVNGTADDAEMAAWLMAICLNGMSEEETYHLTKAMVASGDIITWPADLFQGGPILDKHSSGGVGDKTTLIILPILASLGVPVAKLSGRGLGHTGGTIDKLESIPGFKADQSREDIINQVRACQLYIGAQTDELAPADKAIYALRNKTATVDSIPLIASSIVSKKIASGADAIVFDIKIGNGAFIKTQEEGEVLAHAMQSICNQYGKKTRFLLTDMNQPLGDAVGNAVEVYEAIEILRNTGGSPRLKELCITLAAEMHSLYFNSQTSESEIICRQQLENGQAYTAFSQFIKAQGGELHRFFDLESEFTYDYYATTNGTILQIDTEKIGLAAKRLGAGSYGEKRIDPNAGFVFNKHLGDTVFGGERILQLRYEMTRAKELETVLRMLDEAITIKPTETTAPQPVILKIIR